MEYKDIEEANKKLTPTDIKGKLYMEVNQRIKAFRMCYPEGFIRTEMISNEDGVCIIRASVGYYAFGSIGEVILGQGTAYEKEGSTFINKTSYIENCETSAVGRALGMAGFGIDTSVASAEEVGNAIMQQTVGEQVIDETKAQALRELIKSKAVPTEYVLKKLEEKKYKKISEIKTKDYMLFVSDITNYLGE